VISVIVPTYNNACYLGEALASIAVQTLPVDEIIVVDDGSTDETKQVVAAYNVTFLQQANAGAAAARNRGVASANGTILAFLDADDLWQPTKVALQMAVLANHPTVDMVFGHVEHFVSADLPDALLDKLYCPSMPVPGYLPSSMVIRRKSWDSVGPFNTSWEVGEFVNWYLLAQEKGLTSHMLPQLLVRRRLHRTNQGVLRREARRDYLHIFKAALDRRRTAE
jgi:glycosyltransferase involved in cell wall biosynthesis